MNKNIAIGLVVLVLLLGGGVWVMSQNSTATNTASTQATADADQPMIDTTSEQERMALSADNDIVTNAIASSDHTTLVTAVQAAGLVETLKGQGPFTVFAPTNAAFNKLPAGTVDSLVQPENKTQLTSILTYHVVAGSYKAADLKDGLTLPTVQGDSIRFSQKNGKWWINDSAMVETADITSSNGVIHVIDSVLMPE